MASRLPTASGDISLGKIESPVVEENSATGQQNVDESILEELQAQLQNNRSQTEELSSQIKALNHDNQKLHKQLRTATEELQKKATDSSNEKILRTKITQLTEELEQLRSHSQQLQQENSELHILLGNSVAPDYEATRDRTLAKLKMGKQSAVGKAIDAFIKELRHLKTASTAASVADKASITSKTDDQTVTTTGEQKPPTWEARADDFLKEVAGNG